MSELNITPLLDLVFVLLVIFIITTPQLTNNLELSLPSAKHSALPVEKPKISRITAADGGRLQLDGQEITMAQLEVTLAAKKLSDPETIVVIQGADDVNSQRVVDVLDIVHKLQITKVGLATQSIDAKAE